MRYDYDYEYDPKYCYAGTHILKNKLNIMNNEDLEEVERKICTVIRAAIKNKPPKGDLDFNYLLKLHKRLFADIYDWAGKIRTVNISKGNQFCPTQFIRDYAEGIFDKLKDENYLQGCDPGALSERVAFYLSEINTIHPFREGNGRAQRLFITIMVNRIGYDLLFDKITQEEMIKASAEAFDKEYGLITELIRRCLVELS